MKNDFAAKGAKGAKPKKSSGARGGVPLLASRGDVVTLERVKNLMEQEGGLSDALVTKAFRFRR